ncbi:hypothetical protein [Ralstonia solanacearum]|uniref:Uncharacterized protein n=1 Tax=Ralstonia solanacearum TaxID=305 RepID=A0AAW5ZII0_RALSL|nr:hypothetical protein [Ralstonia solanacearum]AST31101.2 hypothetical protein CDC46_02190 [Ralstonia solanacearum]ATJ87305.1 hypothetical protein CDC59_14115 [Ralstonia solanacearum]AYB52575.2 hypothetical protein C2I38_14570 [Ralstonia solanacearum]AYB57143.1 hypothetical protein C2L97_14560 [Ralstonia solanacearum]MBB6592110.1 hypothetical protein [Ralstonia solanacearum]
MKARHFLLTALLLAILSPAAQADLGEMKQDIKQGTKDAAKKTGHAAREFGHATANAARTVGHGVANAARETKQATKRVFHKNDSE